jgi:hypothetical protein
MKNSSCSKYLHTLWFERRDLKKMKMMPVCKDHIKRKAGLCFLDEQCMLIELAHREPLLLIRFLNRATTFNGLRLATRLGNRRRV